MLHTAPTKLGFVQPMLATLVDEPPLGDDWLHEIKHDGWRAQLVKDGNEVRAFTRNGHDYSRQMGSLVTAARQLRCVTAVIDGEIIVQDENGRSDYEALRRAMTGEQHRLVFYAFDLMIIDGHDLRRMPLRERRHCLQALIGMPGSSFPLQFSDAVEGNGDAVYEAACVMELEGIISKKADSRYKSGRSTSWLKTKCYEEGEFVVLGAEHEPGKPAFALLAREAADGLEYVGSAFVTLGGEQRDRFWNEIERLQRPRAPLNIVGHKKARWAEPTIRVQVQYLKGSAMLRHATVRELL